MTKALSAGYALDAAGIRAGLDALAARDSQMAAAVRDLGYPPERRREPGFAALLRIIAGQQVSTKAAAAVAGRLEAAMNGAPTPEALQALGQDRLRALGLSRQKAAYATGLAEAVTAGRLDVNALAHMPQDDAVAAITGLKGFGPWSARIYLMFSLGRPDIWPADDLGVREGLRRIKGLDERPSVKETERLGAAWSPYRSAAALLCWHILHNTPG